MPSKRAIICNRLSGWDTAYKAVLWADVPSGNQAAYRNPKAVSAYENVTPAELAAIRSGAVAEKVVQCVANGGTDLAGVQAILSAQWADFQAEVSAASSWANYGSYSDGTGSWQASAGVPVMATDSAAEDSAFVALTPSSAFAANKFHFVLHNGEAATSQNTVLKVRLVAVKPGTSTVVGVAPSEFILRRRDGVTTPPSGTGGVAIGAMDAAAMLPVGVTAWCNPQVSPSGGATTTINEFVPQADEQKLSTLDSPTAATLYSNWAGQVVYRAGDFSPGCPLTVRPGQTLEVFQTATAGLGNCRVLVIFTVG